MKPPHAVESASDKTEGTGLPGFHSWRAVYIFVFGSFIIWVVLLLILTRMFA